MDYRRNIIVVGASYGGLSAFSKLLSCLPKSMPAPIFFVQHVSPDHMSHLADILSKQGPLRAIQPTDHSPYEEGTVYTGVPNHHLLVKNAHVRVVHGPTENRFRPSIDALFRSAAAYHTTRVVGVLLTGYQDDGVLGLEAVKRCGGTAIVQDPQEAEVGVLPGNAIQRVQVDEVLPLEGIAKKLVELSALTADPPRVVPEDIMAGAKVSEHEVQALDTMQKIADATPLHLSGLRRGSLEDQERERLSHALRHRACIHARSLYEWAGGGLGERALGGYPVYGRASQAG